MALVVYWPRGLAAPAVAAGALLVGFWADVSTVCVSGAGGSQGSSESVVGRFFRETGAAVEPLDGVDEFLVAVERGAAGPSVLLYRGEEMEARRVKVVLYDAELAASGALAIERQRALPSRSPFFHAPELLDKIGEWHVKERAATSRSRGVAATIGAAAAWCTYPLFAALTGVAIGLDMIVARLKVPSWVPLIRGKSLQDGSRFLALANRRVAAIATWPKRVKHYYQLSSSRPLTCHEQLEVLALVDFVLMVVLDVAIGYYVASVASPWAVIADEKHPLNMLKSAPSDFLRVLRGNISWLMGAPAGFKLNKPLATILGNGVMLWLDMWEFCFSSALFGIAQALGLREISADSASIFPWYFLLTAAWTAMGVTLQLSLVSDAVGICTWSSRWIYQYFAKLNRLQFGLFSSLWKLFVGKKKNVLRKRVDSQEYDISQLLLGTLLFTILVFIVTTTMVFFVFFLLVRTGILACLAALTAPTVAIHALPLAALTLRMCRPRLFTTGMQLEPVRNPKQQVRKCVDVSIRNVGVGISGTDDKLHRREIRNAVSSLDDQTAFGENSSTDISGCAYFELKPIPIGIGHLFSRLRSYFGNSTSADPLSALCDLPPHYWSSLGANEHSEKQA